VPRTVYYVPADYTNEASSVSFRDRIQAAAIRNRTRTILALDLEDHDPSRLMRKSREVLEAAKDCICAVKINRQLVLGLGLKTVADSILKPATDLSLPAIMDAKLNDVGHTNEFMARTYFDAGFDAVIASPTAGWENGLDSVFEIARSGNKGVLLLTYMSNPGAEAFYSLRARNGDGGEKPVFEIMTRLAMEWEAQGVVVGATQPKIISRVRQLVGPTMPIYSPGVGAQGGKPGEAVDAGATYLIVGRAIYASPDPKTAALSVRAAPDPAPV